MEQLSIFINNFISLSAEASPWLLLGLLIAGLMKSWVPSNILSRHLGKGKTAIVKAALIGAPYRCALVALFQSQPNYDEAALLPRLLLLF